VRLLLFFVACSAHFVDERRLPDSSGIDLADLAETAADLAETTADLAGPQAVDLAAQILARGTFSGRAGHSGAGSASLVRSVVGLTVELGGDFAVTGVPGPELVLTARDSIGTEIAAGDLDLGPLRSPNGAQSYAVSDDGGRRNLFVFCKPFGVEVALAVLQP
jgi:hypothetical protein